MKPKCIGVGGETYIYEKVDEEFTGEWPEEASSPSLRWGRECEPYAVKHYESAFGIKTEPAYFIQNKSFSNLCGGSPDRLIPSEKIGLEIKCPYVSSKHAKYMHKIKNAESLKKYSDEYYWQVMMCIFLTGYKKWEFISYNPRYEDKYKMYVVDIYPVKEDIFLLKERLIEAIKIKSEILNELKKL